MTQQRRPFSWQTKSGETLTVGDVSVTPQSKALSARWPGGGGVWNRPVAVLVRRDGREWRVPILDVTRIAQLGLYGLSLVFVLVGLYGIFRNRRE